MTEPTTNAVGKDFSKGAFFEQPLSFELSSEGICGVDIDLPKNPLKWGQFDERKEIGLPSISEPTTVRHYTRLSLQNFCIDSSFYPLGSCTMKYNPRLNEKLARIPNFANLHPLQTLDTIQGALELMYETQIWLKKMSGLHTVCLSLAAGAHGELAGLLTIKKTLEARGEHRKYIIVADSAHGTNPCSAKIAGFEPVSLSLKDGLCDLEKAKELVEKHGKEIAGIMITNPSTCGIAEKSLKEIVALVHGIGGFFYCDGANFNAIVGKVKPADFGADIMHFNLHKTFSTPHGGGGPGSGPIACTEELAPFLPPTIVDKLPDGSFGFREQSENAVGKMKGFINQFPVLVRAYSYFISCGINGLRQNSEDAILSANYLYYKLKDIYRAPYYTEENKFCMHELLLTDSWQKAENGVTTLDIAKALIDKGMHPMTIYFPTMISGALLIEPTETETKDTLDEFVENMLSIAKEAKENPDLIKQRPLNTIRKRVDEFRAAKTPKVTYDDLLK